MPKSAEEKLELRTSDQAFKYIREFMHGLLKNQLGIKVRVKGTGPGTDKPLELEDYKVETKSIKIATSKKPLQHSFNNKVNKALKEHMKSFSDRQLVRLLRLMLSCSIDGKLAIEDIQVGGQRPDQLRPFQKQIATLIDELNTRLHDKKASNSDTDNSAQTKGALTEPKLREKIHTILFAKKGKYPTRLGRYLEHYPEAYASEDASLANLFNTKQTDLELYKAVITAQDSKGDTYHHYLAGKIKADNGPYVFMLQNLFLSEERPVVIAAVLMGTKNKEGKTVFNMLLENTSLTNWTTTHTLKTTFRFINSDAWDRLEDDEKIEWLSNLLMKSFVAIKNQFIKAYKEDSKTVGSKKTDKLLKNYDDLIQHLTKTNNNDDDDEEEEEKAAEAETTAFKKMLPNVLSAFVNVALIFAAGDKINIKSAFGIIKAQQMTVLQLTMQLAKEHPDNIGAVALTVQVMQLFKEIIDILEAKNRNKVLAIAYRESVKHDEIDNCLVPKKDNTHELFSVTFIKFLALYLIRHTDRNPELTASLFSQFLNLMNSSKRANLNANRLMGAEVKLDKSSSGIDYTGSVNSALNEFCAGSSVAAVELYKSEDESVEAFLQQMQRSKSNRNALRKNHGDKMIIDIIKDYLLGNKTRLEQCLNGQDKSFNQLFMGKDMTGTRQRNIVEYLNKFYAKNRSIILMMRTIVNKFQDPAKQAIHAQTYAEHLFHSLEKFAEENPLSKKTSLFGGLFKPKNASKASASSSSSNPNAYAEWASDLKARVDHQQAKMLEQESKLEDTSGQASTFDEFELDSDDEAEVTDSSSAAAPQV